MSSILFITSKDEDFLSDCLLHGLRTTHGSKVVDYPKKSVMYKNYLSDRKIYGNGFTIFKTLDDVDIDRANIEQRLANREFDIIIFSSIHRQYDQYRTLRKFLTPQNTIIVDGEDHGRYAFNLQSYSLTSFLKLFHSRRLRHFLYFKREILTVAKDCPENVRPISFSFPSSKIDRRVSSLDEKIQRFQSHIVDPEFVENREDRKKRYLFDEEQDYYRDLQRSKFGITTKKAGWDCLRHYEIAGNKAVICFKNLDQKPPMCAPHGLIDGTNCLSYSSRRELEAKIECLDEQSYADLHKNTLTWVEDRTTSRVAKSLLSEFERFRESVI